MKIENVLGVYGNNSFSFNQATLAEVFLYIVIYFVYTTVFSLMQMMEIIVHVAIKLQSSLMMLYWVDHVHIITEEHFHLLPEFTALNLALMMMVMMLLGTAGVMFSVGLSLSIHTPLREGERGRGRVGGVCVSVLGSGRVIEKKAVL